MIRPLALPLAAAMIAASATPALAEEFTVKLAHGPITATLNPVTPGTASPGDMRLFYIDLTRPGKRKVVGFLTGSLLTTAVGKPVPGKEYRAADLIFTVGGSQLVLGGVAVYDQNAPTVSKRSSVIRPVIGGTGMYAGAHGWAKSTRFKDNTWRHTFHVDVDE